MAAMYYAPNLTHMGHILQESDETLINVSVFTGSAANWFICDGCIYDLRWLNFLVRKQAVSNPNEDSPITSRDW